MARRTLRWVQRSHERLRSMKSATCAANDVGHLELWPTHLLLLGRPAFLEHQRIQRTGRGMQVPLREVEIASGFFQIVMA